VLYEHSREARAILVDSIFLLFLILIGNTVVQEINQRQAFFTRRLNTILTASSLSSLYEKTEKFSWSIQNRGLLYCYCLLCERKAFREFFCELALQWLTGGSQHYSSVRTGHSIIDIFWTPKSGFGRVFFFLLRIWASLVLRLDENFERPTAKVHELATPRIFQFYIRMEYTYQTVASKLQASTRISIDSSIQNL
jgi:hypothetical protein